MQTSALHNPYSEVTPSQYEAAKARRERLAKIAAVGLPDAGISLRRVLAVAEVKRPEPKPEFTFEQWIERQENLNPIPKEPWFSIESEIDEPEPEPVRPPRIEEIQRAVCKYYGVTRDDMISGRRYAPIVLPRQIAGYICRKMTLRSLPEIGRRFGGRDHTTQLHAIRKIAALIKTEGCVGADVEAIMATIRRGA